MNSEVYFPDSMGYSPRIPPGYKQTEVGVIPEDWEDTKLGEIAEIRMCKRIFAEQTNVSGDIPFFKIGTFGKTPDAYISYDIYQEFKRKYSFPKKGEILLSAAGTLGKTVVYDGQDAYFQDSNIIWLEINPYRITNDFLYQCYQVIKWASPEGSTISRLYNGIIRDTRIPLPPNEKEQTAIAAALSDVDALLEALDRLIAKKRDIKLAAMQQLLTGKTRLPGFEGEWEVKRLGDHVIFLRNGTNSRAELQTEGKVKYLHYGDIHGSSRHSLTPSALPSLPLEKAVGLDRLRDGDLIFADASEDLAGIGKSVEIHAVGDTDVVAGLHTISARFDKNVLADEFKAYLQFCACFINPLRRLAAGTKVYATNRKHIAGIEMALPEVQEQTAIAQVLSDMDAEIEALEKRREKTKDLKQAMMQELLTGRVRLVKPKKEGLKYDFLEPELRKVAEHE